LGSIEDKSKAVTYRFTAFMITVDNVNLIAKDRLIYDIGHVLEAGVHPAGRKLAGETHR